MRGSGGGTVAWSCSSCAASGRMRHATADTLQAVLFHAQISMLLLGHRDKNGIEQNNICFALLSGPQWKGKCLEGDRSWR